MNKQMQKHNKEESRSVTAASVTAKYCDGCQVADTGAVSCPVTTKLIPVDVTVAASDLTIHPGECVTLQVTVCNHSDQVLTDAKFQVSSCSGIKVCECPNVGEIRDGQSSEFQIKIKAEQNAPSRCNLKVCLLFCVDGCRCKACSEGMILSVSRVVPRITIRKEADAACCVTPGMTVKVLLTVCNTGTVSLKDLCVTDELPGGVEYTPNSTSVNGGSCFDADPRKGISLECLKAGECVKIGYCMTVKGMQCGC